MYTILENVCQKMSAYARTEIRIGEPFDAKELAAKFTIDVVSCCIYGIDSKAFTNDYCQLRDYGGQVLKPSTKVLIYFTAITALPFLSKIWKVPFCAKHVEDYFIDLMNDAVALRLRSKIERNDYLNYLLELKQKKNISNIDMAAHTMTFLIDGFDTSSSLIAHALYLLARNKNVVTKLRDEINDTIRRDGGVTFENLQEMEYLDQVFNG